MLVYFAGHGAPVIDPSTSSPDGMEKYLIPHDADVEDLRSTGIAMNSVQQWFAWIPPQQVIFFIDSCYIGGAGGRSFEREGFSTRATFPCADPSGDPTRGSSARTTALRAPSPC